MSLDLEDIETKSKTKQTSKTNENIEVKTSKKTNENIETNEFIENMKIED